VRACIGVGHVPAKGMKSLRAINRNFKGRTGQKEDEVYLSSSEVAAASAITGVITDRGNWDPAPVKRSPRSWTSRTRAWCLRRLRRTPRRSG